MPLEALVILPHDYLQMVQDISSYLPMKQGLYRISKNIALALGAGESLRFYSHNVSAEFTWMF